MSRCSYSHTDGRQCVRPAHTDTVRHMLAPPTITRDQAAKIAAAWGFPLQAANAAASGATSAGAIPAGKFIRMIEVAADAFVRAVKADEAAKAKP